MLEQFLQTSGSTNTIDLNIIGSVGQLILAAFAGFASYLLQKYVRGTSAERYVATITEVVRQGTRYVERLDGDGKLNLGPEESKGLKKLALATEYVKQQIDKAGLKSISEDEIHQWINAELQRQMGSEIMPVRAIAAAAQESIGTISALLNMGRIDLPPGTTRESYIAELAADRIVARVKNEHNTNLARSDALAAAWNELVNSLSGGPVDLAEKAFTYLSDLKAKGKLALIPGIREEEIAAAFMLTEALKEGVALSSDEIAHALKGLPHYYEVGRA